MKGRWAIILATGLTLAPVQANDELPSPELLELLGLFGALEELGVDVDQQIVDREAQALLPKQPTQASESEEKP